MSQEKDFTTRFGLTDEQFGVLTTFYALLSRKTGPKHFAYRATEFGLTSAELETLRGHALDMFITNARLIDEQDKEEGTVDAVMDESGVGANFSQELSMRAMVNAFSGYPMERAAEIANVSVEAMNVLHEIFITRLLYMGAVALRYNPSYTALDLIRGLTVQDSFCDWFEGAIPYLDEDFEKAEAQASGNDIETN